MVLGKLGAGALLLHAVGDFRALVETWKSVVSARTSLPWSGTELLLGAYGWNL